MASSKLKNLVIFILLLANLFLLVLVVPARLEKRKMARQEQTQLTRLFADAGVELLPTGMPKTAERYSLELTLSQPNRIAFAERFIGEAVRTETPNHEILLVGEKGRGKLGADGVLTLTVDGAAKVADPAAEVKDRLGEAELSPAKVEVNEENTAVSAYFSYQNLPIFTDALQFTYADGALKSLTGTPLCVESAVRTDRTACISAEDALLAFLSSRVELGWVGSRILSVEQGYRSKTALQTVSLTPCWRIETDTGAFYVDGITAAVSAV